MVVKTCRQNYNQFRLNPAFAMITPTPSPSATRITPFLWFDTNAEAAVAFYLSVFPNSRQLSVLRASTDTPAAPAGAVLTIAFELAGIRFTALNGGPALKFTDAVSFMIHCRNQDEIDHYWSHLTSGGGQEIACGWLRDKFGLAWQVIPIQIFDLLRHPAAMRAMMGMKKMILAELEAAARSS